MAELVTPGGQLHVAGVQQPMLDATLERARRNGVTVLATLADEPGRLPYDDASFDGAYLSSVLGEITNPTRALAELHRVLRPKGRLVVTEVAGDPDFISPKRLRRMAEGAGFDFDERRGPFVAYHACFVRPGSDRP